MYTYEKDMRRTGQAGHAQTRAGGRKGNRKLTQTGPVCLQMRDSGKESEFGRLRGNVVQREPIPQNLLQAIQNYHQGEPVTDELRRAVVLLDHTILNQINDDTISRGALHIKAFMRGTQIDTAKMLPDQMPAYDIPPADSGGTQKTKALGNIPGFENIHISITEFDHMQVLRDNSQYITPVKELKIETARADRRMARIVGQIAMQTLTWLFSSLSREEKETLGSLDVSIQFVVGTMGTKQQQSAWTLRGGRHEVRIFIKSSQRVMASSVPTMLSGRTPNSEIKLFTEEELAEYTGYIISHEMGHVLHALLHPAEFKVLSTLLNTGSIETAKVPAVFRRMIETALPGSSMYAVANVREALAELYTAMVNGIRIPEVLYSWYKANGGPQVRAGVAGMADAPLPPPVRLLMASAFPGSNHSQQTVKEAVNEISAALGQGEEVPPLLLRWYTEGRS